jgi:hypothetical protein
MWTGRRRNVKCTHGFSWKTSSFIHNIGVLDVDGTLRPLGLVNYSHRLQTVWDLTYSTNPTLNSVYTVFYKCRCMAAVCHVCLLAFLTLMILKGLPDTYISFFNTCIRCSFSLIKLSWRHIEPDWCPYNGEHWDCSALRCYRLRFARMAPRFQSSGPADTTVRGAPLVVAVRRWRELGGKVQITKLFFFWQQCWKKIFMWSFGVDLIVLT